MIYFFHNGKFFNSNLYKDSNKENQMEEKEEQLMLSAEFLDNTYEEEINDINQRPEDRTQNRILNIITQTKIMI